MFTYRTIIYLLGDFDIARVEEPCRPVFLQRLTISSVLFLKSVFQESVRSLGESKNYNADASSFNNHAPANLQFD